jgi:hypothetical protein
MIGWIDPRALNEDQEVMTPQEMAQYEGELAWEARFSLKWTKDMEYELGQYAFAGQYQQSPMPRKGGIIKREYWQFYVPPTEGRGKGAFPELDMVIVSLDVTGAFAEFERSMIRQRIKAGLKRAVAQGSKLGRPKVDAALARKAEKQLKKGVGILKVAKMVGLGTGAVQRIKQEMGVV